MIKLDDLTEEEINNGEVDQDELKVVEEHMKAGWGRPNMYRKANTIDEEELNEHDMAYLENIEKDDDPMDEASAGCTAVTCLLRNKKLIV